MSRRASRRSSPARIAVLLAWPVMAVALAAAAAPPTPCADDPRHRELDFWVGEWRVVTADGETVATDRIEAAEGGCLLLGRRTAAGGGSGLGMTFLDPATGTWRQLRVDAAGEVARYEGRLEGGVLRLEGTIAAADGSERASRVTLQPLDDGTLRHRVEQRDDGGAWSLAFDGRYEKPGAPGRPAAEAPAPAAAAPSAAAPSEPAAAQVKAVSAEMPDDALAPDARRRVQMVSPMTLEVVLGPLDLYPDNAAWTTDETAPFECNDVSLREVGAAKILHRGKATVEARLLLHTNQRGQRAGLVVELLDAEGTVVARAEEPRISLGLMISSYDPEKGLLRTLDLDLERDLFDSLFAGGRRPRLRVTLEVAPD